MLRKSNFIISSNSKQFNDYLANDNTILENFFV